MNAAIVWKSTNKCHQLQLVSACAGAGTTSPWRNPLSPTQPGGTSLVNMAAATAAATASSPPLHPSLLPSLPTGEVATPSPAKPTPDPRQSPTDPNSPLAEQPILSWTDTQLSAELLAKSVSAASPRLLLRNFSIARIRLLFDIHVANGGPNIPIALDTQRQSSAFHACCSGLISSLSSMM